jgi:ribosomal protein S18 acetylase RimI-like enzyme
MTKAAVEITVAEGAAAIATLRGLFREYQAQLGVDLCFQGFEAELAALPGDYAPPLGCVAMRPLDATTCEMKRLYVRDAARGLGLGRRLAERLIAEARALGYRRMVLDTLPSMAAAQGLYRSLGFAPIAPYTFNPVEGSRYLGLDLAAEGAA